MKKVYATLALTILAGSLGGYFLLQKKKNTAGGSDFLSYCNSHIEMDGKAASLKQLKRKSKANTCEEIYAYVASRGAIQLGSVIEIESLKYFTDVTSMELDVLSDIDLSTLSDVRNLTSLTIFSSFDHPTVNGLKDFLSHNKKLEKLALGNLTVTPETGLLDGNENVKVIEISETAISSLETFGKLPALERLSFPFAPIDSLQGIEKFPALKELVAAGTKVKDVKPLEALKNLKNLDLTYTDVIDVKPLENLTNLEQVLLEKNKNTETTAEIQCPENTKNPALAKLCTHTSTTGKQANL